MGDDVFVSEKNLVSKRWAVFEEDDNAGWLYLTEVNQTKPIANCWIYNKVKAPIFSEIEKYRPEAPPASIEFVDVNYLRLDVNEADVSFKWSNDGNSVAVSIQDTPMGFIIFGEKRGYSRNLIKKCDWGNVFDGDKYALYFERIGSLS